MRRIRWRLPCLISLLTCGVTACSVYPNKPVVLSFADVPSAPSGLRYQLPVIATDADTAAGGEDGVLSLPRAWQLALQYNHTYQAAIKSRKAAATLRAQGWAKLLPHIQAGYSYFHINGQRWQPSPFGGTFKRPLSYNAQTAYVRLEQPLVDFGRYSSYRWYVARARQGWADWQAARYALAEQLLKAWLNVLDKRAKLALDQALEKSLAGQLKAQEALYQHGSGRITDVRQTRSRLTTIRARLISDQGQLQLARRSLQALIGYLPNRIEGMATDPTIPAMLPGQLGEWLRRARTNNARVEARQVAEKVAMTVVERDVKSQWPRLHFMASWKHDESGEPSTLGQRSNTYAVGLQLSVPIFSGGASNAQVVQSRAKRRQASHELDQAIQEAQTEIARHYRNVRGAVERIRALRVSVNAGEHALKATRIGYKYGTKDNLDVLQTRNELFQAREELIQARLDLLRSYIQLRLTSGKDLTTVFRRADTLFFSTSGGAPRSNVGLLRVEGALSFSVPTWMRPHAESFRMLGLLPLSGLTKTPRNAGPG